MKKLIIWLALLLPFIANAQINGTIQKTASSGTIRGSFGSLGIDTIPRVTGVFVNGYILKYNASTNKWYASPDPTLVGLQDSLTKKANRTFDNVASGAIAKAKADTSATGLQTVSNFFPKGDTRWAKIGDIPTLGTSAISLGGTANGLSYSAGNYRLHKVTATTGGVLTTGTDTLAGIKTLTSTPKFLNGAFFDGTGDVYIPGQRTDAQVSVVSPDAGGHALIDIYQRNISASANNEEGAVSFQGNLRDGRSQQMGSLSMIWGNTDTTNYKSVVRLHANSRTNSNSDFRLHGGDGIVLFGNNANDSIGAGNNHLLNRGWLDQLNAAEMHFTRINPEPSLWLPASGKGLEFRYRTDGGNDYALIQSYDTDGATFKQLYITSSLLKLNETGGVILVGGATDDGTAFNVTGSGKFSNTITSATSNSTNLNNTTIATLGGSQSGYPLYLKGRASDDFNGIQFQSNAGVGQADLGVNSSGEYLFYQGVGTTLRLTLGSAATFTVPVIMPTGSTAITQTAGDNSTKIATTAYVDVALSAKTSRQLKDWYADANNVTTTETDLYDYTVPSNTLVNNGDKLYFEIGGIYGGTANSKDLRLYFGNSGFLFQSTTSSGGSWTIKGFIVKVDATNYRIVATNSDDAPEKISTYSSTGTVTNYTGTNVFKITGTGTASADITAKSGYLEFKPAAP